MAKTRIVQEEALKKQQAGHEPLSSEAAAIRMQSAARGFLFRCRVKHDANNEMSLLNINPFARSAAQDTAFGRLREIQLKRRSIQLLNYDEYLDAMRIAKEQLIDLEGQEMREIIQESINKWLNDHRDPDTGFFPPFPKAGDGGSKYIVQPPPKLGFHVEEKKGKKEDKKEGKKKKAKGPPVPPHPILPEEDPEKPPSCPKFFLRHVRECLELYTRNWHDKDNSADLTQKHDMEMLKSHLRPMVFEQIRLEVDETTRVILDKVKQKIVAELKAARKKQKGDAAKPEKKEAKKDDADEAAPPPKNKPKKLKDTSAQRTIESLYAELAKAGIIQAYPKRDFSEFVATDSFFGTNFEMDPVGLDPSMSQVKRLAMEYCVFPLVSDFVHEHAPFIKSVLLYGGSLNGKKLLVHAACRTAGATYINLSPEVTDGQYPGKQATKMLQMAFKIARVMAPSIVHVDGVEKLFVTDKKKLKTYGLKDKANRYKKPLLKEVQGIRPGDRVMFVGTSSSPQDSPGKPPALANFFNKRIYVPYPDHGCRSSLWRALIERHGGRVTDRFNLSTISHVSEGYSSGMIEQFCKAVLTEKRKRKVRSKPLAIDEFTTLIYDTKPVDPEVHQVLREWAKPKAVDPAAAQDPKAAKGGKKK
ncbi:IQ and AAA domain-containing protein 1 [Selaginella moellendorffii]|uniref:IQ and AAA domain-containing protein 1 n=1 Tax=Selaginella moellendorffii TaxID=88036 RepID=UPI000D1C9D43|nr:IQ and AAA domain-containing protein 1 [Selaginella moellendorffii]XP_024529623.1 IQ and AAA domain-containing protein 1 [Selaginella moellendorffii]|eukprot:XP_024529622.1 IQ and AAA domain-containing protein 1 [Selaginella moellendorffii]